MKRTASTMVLGLLVMLSAAACAAQEGMKGSRGITVDDLRNDKPGFAVRVDVDHADRRYVAGQEVKVTVQSNKDGYLYLFYESAAHNIQCIFPNYIQKDNRIKAGERITVPAANAEFRFRVTPPFGREVLKAIVVTSQVMPKMPGVTSLTKGPATAFTGSAVKGMAVELKRDLTNWAEHGIDLLTSEKAATASPEPSRPPAPRRVGLFIGISRFQDSGIRPLKVSHRDAIEMAEVMKNQGGFDEVIVKTDEEATLENIHKAICGDLVQKTSPGDLVMIYWSGHGARCADDNGDEKDGYDEYLVPYDGRLDDLETIRRTMLIDDTFGRWAQELDERKILVVLDTCHSGGQHDCEKSLGLPDPVGSGEFDFLDGDLDSHMKDLGQKNTALLASAKAAQVAVERREGDLSAMTYFLIKKLKEAQGEVTLPEAYEYLKVEVPAYVKERFQGMVQEPVLLDYITPPVILRK